MEKLILFDIDKTLIKKSEGHWAAFSEGFKKVYGVDANIYEITHHGMTDQQIIIEILKIHGVAESEIKPKIKECMKAMIDYFNSVKNSASVEVFSGVAELLKELENKNFLLGLVTGNLEPIARGKLEKVGLNHYFKLGGFGSDDLNRANLVKIAIGRAKKNFNFTHDNNVFLFGDTPKDIKAGNSAGVITVGVATGIYSKEELKSASPDYTIDNLEDINSILKNILS